MPFLIVVAYAFILVVAVGISGYLSYHGLLSTSEEITLPLVILLMTIILSMDAAVSLFRSTKRKYKLILFIWAIAAFFSISSNFNHLYTNFMRNDVTRATVTTQLGVFRDDLIVTRAKLAGLDSNRMATNLRTDLRIELDNLLAQITDPLRPGCGQECRGHLAEVERILGRSITNFATPPIGSPADVVEDWYRRYSGAAEEMLQNSLQATQYPALAGLIRQIDDALIENDSAERVLTMKGGLDALTYLSQFSADVERRANALLPREDQVAHRHIDATLGRLGEIVYSIQNGFGEMPNPIATAVCLVLGSLVDVLPLLLSFALFGPGRLERAETTPKRGPGGRKVLT